MNREGLGLFLIGFGIILIIDELGFLMPGVRMGWLLGDLSMFHIEPFHHWMLGAGFVICGIMLRRGVHD